MDDQQFYKQKYSLGEFYNILYRGLQTAPALRRNKKNKQMSDKFIERIMLAVTKVNGCPVCSYGHTKIALEQGMTIEEIEMLLTGENENVPAEEMQAILFAQHYAETKGHPSEKAWQKIITTYGEEKAHGILGATRLIMIGNSYGIPLSAFRSRLKGKPVERSGLTYELAMLFSIIPLLPIAIVHVLFATIIKRPLITFTNEG